MLCQASVAHTHAQISQMHCLCFQFSDDFLSLGQQSITSKELLFFFEILATFFSLLSTNWKSGGVTVAVVELLGLCGPIEGWTVAVVELLGLCGPIEGWTVAVVELLGLRGPIEG